MPTDHLFRMLGVEWDIRPDEVRVSAGQERVEKLLIWIEQILKADRLSPTEAAKLAGKLHFVCSWVFASVVKALLKPLYKRQQACSSETSRLSVSIRAGLHELTVLLPQLKPMSFPMRPDDLTTFASACCMQTRSSLFTE